MQVALPSAIALIASALVTGSAGPSQPAHDPDVSVTFEDIVRADGTMGCLINFTTKNSGREVIYVRMDVRSKSLLGSFGPWKRIGDNWPIKAGETNWSKALEMGFNCNHERQYRIDMHLGEPNKVGWQGMTKAAYIPTSGTTTLKTIAMGDLYTKFFK